MTTPLALVERKFNFDKNPRLAKVVGFSHPQPPVETENNL